MNCSDPSVKFVSLSAAQAVSVGVCASFAASAAGLVGACAPPAASAAGRGVYVLPTASAAGRGNGRVCVMCVGLSESVVQNST